MAAKEGVSYNTLQLSSSFLDYVVFYQHIDSMQTNGPL